MLNEIETRDDLAAELFQNVRPPEHRDQILGMLDQRLHNYLASAAALVDHTRRLFGRYSGTPVATEYEHRKEAVARVPVVGFVKDLRNFLLHRRIPFVGHTVKIIPGPGGGIRATMEVSVRGLTDWSGWRGPAKAYLRTSGDTIRLSTVPVEYDAQIDALYDWVFAQFGPLHGADIDHLNTLIDEYNWLISGGQKGKLRPGAVPAPRDGV